MVHYYRKSLVLGSCQKSNGKELRKMSITTEKHRTWLTQALPVILLLLGGALRLLFLGEMPDGMHQDESTVAWNAFAILHEGMDSAGHYFPVYMADWGDGHSALYVWLLIPFLALNGGHVTPFFSRLPQAIVSIFTLWAVYCLVKRLFNRNAGLWSLFVLAICPWHIMMSRWGLDANMAPGFLIFGLYFFIRGLDQKKYLLLSGFFYGMSLHAYAVIWPIVPIILIMQILYCLAHKKLRVDRWSLSASLILFIIAFPLLLFVLVNADLIPEITLPFITIPQMGGYRGSEIALSIPEMWYNFRTALSLLWHQNTSAPYDILLPWGLFYDIGRFFIIFGVIALLVRLAAGFRKREFVKEYFLFVQLVGGGITCLLVNAGMHRINSLYIPLVLAQGYGIWTLIELLQSRKKQLAQITSAGITAIYLFCLVMFQRDYYTDYRQLAAAYYGDGLQECVDFALEQCAERNLAAITVEKGAQWPRLLLFTETLPSDYLSSVVYDIPPAPASFETQGIHINTRINYDSINYNSIYIIYFVDVPVFEDEFTLTQFHDWYVAVPK